MNDLATKRLRFKPDRASQQALYAASFQLILFAALSTLSHTLLIYVPGTERAHPVGVALFLTVSASSSQLAFFYTVENKQRPLVRALLWALGLTSALALWRLLRFEQTEEFSMQLAVMALLVAAAFAAVQARLIGHRLPLTPKFVASQIAATGLAQLSFLPALFGAEPAVAHRGALALSWLAAIAVGTGALLLSQPGTAKNP